MSLDGLVVEHDRVRPDVRRDRSPCPADRGLEQVHRRAPDEPRHEEVDGPVVQLLRRGDLLQLAAPHDGHAISHRHGLDLVVRHVDRGDVELLLQARDLGARLHAQLRVEVRERLVHQERLRVAHDGAPHGHALALPAGEGARLAVEQRLEPERLRGVPHPPVDLGLRHLLDAQSERDVLVHAEVRVEGVALEHHGDVAIARGHVVDDALADPDRAFRDGLEPRDHAKGGGLAAAGRAHEHHELAVGDVQVEVADRPHAAVVHLGDVLERHGAH